MNAPDLKPLIDHLHGQGKLRVWSLIVTILGDVAVPHGNQISGADLLAITGSLGIDEGAVRTAITRLRQDGWIVSERLGRSSVYSAAAPRLPELKAATSGIYAALKETPPDQAWHLVITQTPMPKGIHGLISVDRRVFLGTNQIKPPPGSLVLSGHFADIPEWVHDAVCPQDVTQKYADFANRFEPYAKGVLQCTPTQALALRTLLIHNWRRLVLRHPLPPGKLMPANWSGIVAAVRVAAIYRDLIQSSERAFDPTLAARALPVLDTRFR